MVWEHTMLGWNILHNATVEPQLLRQEPLHQFLIVRCPAQETPVKHVVDRIASIFSGMGRTLQQVHPQIPVPQIMAFLDVTQRGRMAVL